MAGSVDKPLDPDTGGDGFSDAQERNLGTDPADANSYFRILAATHREPGVVELTWPSLPGKTYVVESSQTLTANSWTPVPRSNPRFS